MTEGAMLSTLSKYLPLVHLVRSNYFSKGPRYVDIELSNRCNLRCKMCWFHGENGIGDRYRHSEMTTAEIKELINQLAEYRPCLYFGGGEPFIREEFIEILAHAKRFSLPISFTTNATLLDPNKIEKIIELRIDTINFSIDGYEELHDRLRGNGNFRRAISNIQLLLERKKKEKIETPGTFVNITVTPLIIGHLKETIDSIRNLTQDEIDFYRIHHLWFITPGELEAHQREVRTVLERRAPLARSHCMALSPSYHSTALSDEILELRDNRKVIFFPDIHGPEIRAFYSDGYRSTRRCMAPFQAVLVKPNGDLKFCPDEWIDDYVLGNVRNERFRTIWDNKKTRYFRSTIFRKKSFPACKRCSWMYSY
jgi:radical SAM protein with 4Fe4S-binding SPASM domain